MLSYNGTALILMYQSFYQRDDGKLVNKITGEILDNKQGTLVFIPRKIRLKDNFTMIFDSTWELFSKDKDLQGQTRQILDYMLNHMDFGNTIDLTQAEIARGLLLPASRVHESVKKLVAKNVLIQHKKRGKSWTYKLNPEYGWKGKATDLIAELNGDNK